MYKNKKIAAIILIAGEGRRFSSDLPKQFHMLSGKKVYLHTLEVFEKLSIFDSIIVVCSKAYKSMIQKDLKNKKTKITVGGATRQDSVYNALLKCQNIDIVSIHDGVRPLLSQEIILNGIEKAITYGAANTCIETFDTIVKTEDQNFLESIPIRKNLLRGQTPQTFEYKLILDAHKRAKKQKLKNITDDCALVMKGQHKISIVKGDPHNIKITTSLDLFLAEQLLRLKTTEKKDETLSIENKKYIVVGATGGIGKEICKLLIQNKAIPIGISKSSEDLSIDLRDKKSIKKALNKIYEKHGKVDGLINSAGFLKVAPFKSLSFKKIEELISINLTGLIYCCKEAKIKDNGHIINIASSAYVKGRKNSSIYSSAKSGVVNFTQALAEELPLKVNVLVPKRTNTKMRRDNFPKEDIESLLSPKTVASYVISTLKSSMTGSIIEIKKD